MHELLRAPAPGAPDVRAPGRAVRRWPWSASSSRSISPWRSRSTRSSAAAVRSRGRRAHRDQRRRGGRDRPWPRWSAPLALRGGGGRVARELGGVFVPPDTTDPQLRRLRNVVEEMAIASGVPVPEIYVLPDESAINAFAAGWSTSDAAVAVTRGALDRLNRDELQGVIAHEFSHVVNGDMRLNIRLIGLLFGILFLSVIGRTLLQGSFLAGGRGRDESPGQPAAADRLRAARRGRDRGAGRPDHPGLGVPAAGVPGRRLGRPVHPPDQRHRRRAEEDRRPGCGVEAAAARRGKRSATCSSVRREADLPVRHASAACRPHTCARTRL